MTDFTPHTSLLPCLLPHTVCWEGMWSLASSGRTSCIHVDTAQTQGKKKELFLKSSVSIISIPKTYFYH